MNLKTTVLSLSALLLCGSAMAQDKIYKRNGDVIDAKVSEVGTKSISYKKADNHDGPNYVINKSEIDRVEYANGDEDYFADDRRHMPGGAREPRGPKPSHNTKYGNNIISASPMQITDNGLGVAISYERVLDKKRNIVSFYMPIAMSFNNRYANDYYNNYGGYGYNNGDYNPTFYFMPGLKIYPTGGKGIVRYSVGPNLAFVTTKSYEYNGGGYPYYSPGTITEKNIFIFGMMVTNSLNINPTPHLHLALELGLGMSYTEGNRNNYYNSYDPMGFAQFGFKMGYRF